ncbi:MAG TPA: nucleoside monophosphate kinase [Verrucomicrobiae bacterium]|nr:nucleoside monophosphate kinase [Verrucomicrobiae bacterium]
MTFQRTASHCALITVLLASGLRAAGPLVVLIGAPGSGRATQAEILRKERGMAIISVDDLIARNQQMFERFKRPEIQGVDPHLDPALNPLVEEALKSADLTHGVVLYRYPAAKIQGDFLLSLREKLGLPKALVIHLRVPDDVARKRLEGEHVPAADIEQQLKDYHREVDFVRVYFPEADIHDVDGNQTREKVAKAISKLLGKQ